MTPPQPNAPLPDPPPDASSGDIVHAAPALDRALELVRFLRANCEWDAAQTPESLIRYLLEEAAETADAIRARDADHLSAELGDLLLNIAFQIVIAEERAQFTAHDVARALESKMRRRHPHLYGDGPRASWDEIKSSESASASAGPATGPGGASLLDEVPTGLPPLERAHAVQARVAQFGFDWPDATGAYEKVKEEVEEIGEILGPADDVRDRLEDEIGDLLFAAVNLARLSGIDSTAALRRANAKFSGRFRELEREARIRGIVLGEASLEELDAIWNDVKRR